MCGSNYENERKLIVLNNDGESVSNFQYLIGVLISWLERTNSYPSKSALLLGKINQDMVPDDSY